MTEELRLANMEQVEIFSRWSGGARHQVAKLLIVREGDGFVREDVLSGARDTMTMEPIVSLLTELARARVPALDPNLFDIPEPVIRRHFGSVTCGANPQCLVRLTFSGGWVVNVLTTSDHLHLLPILVYDSGGLHDFETFNPALSRAMAGLMPEGFLQRELLAGWDYLLQLEIAEYENGTGIWQAWDERVRAADERAAQDVERLQREWSEFDREQFLKRMAEEVEVAQAESPRNGLMGMQFACSRGNEDAIDELLRRGVDVNLRDDDGSTPLMWGADSPGVMRKLVAAGARVNDVDNEGHSALVYVIDSQCWFTAECCFEALRLLIDAGADLQLRDNEELTPLGFARRYHRLDLLEEETSEAIQLARSPSRQLPEESPAEKRARIALTKDFLLRDFGSTMDPEKWNAVVMSRAVVKLIEAAGGLD